MTFITLAEAKEYLRVDSSDEDAVIGSLLSAAGNLCRDVARLTDEQWADIDSDKCCSKYHSRAQMTDIRETPASGCSLCPWLVCMNDREEADHHALTLTLRSLLFGIREGV